MYPPAEAIIEVEMSHHLQTSETTPSDLAVVVDELLNQLSTKFSNISTELIGKSKSTLSSLFFHRTIDPCDLVDDMSRRLDTLEATIQSNAGGADKEETM